MRCLQHVDRSVHNAQNIQSLAFSNVFSIVNSSQCHSNQEQFCYFEILIVLLTLIEYRSKGCGIQVKFSLTICSYIGNSHPPCINLWRVKNKQVQWCYTGLGFSITQNGSAVYIGIAMVFVFLPYMKKLGFCFHFQVNVTSNVSVLHST